MIITRRSSTINCASADRRLFAISGALDRWANRFAAIYWTAFARQATEYLRTRGESDDAR